MKRQDQIKSASQVKSLFLAGRFVDVSSEFASKSELQDNQELMPYWIGALVFTGNLEKALALFEPTELSTDLRVACRFYIILGYIRKSMYGKAKEELAKNLKEKKNTTDAQDLFYIYQGIAFYRFFCGRYLAARKHVNNSYSYAIKSRFVFGEMISRDLLAHTLIQLGQNREGLKLFDQAMDLAEQNNNEWLSAAIRISILKFRAQLGIQPTQDLEDLKKALLKLAPQDTYSIAELLLEMIRQHILRGQFTEAEACFSKASEVIYKHQNRRQIALLNLRMSYMLYLQGQYMQAMHIVRFAEQNIDASIDLNLWTQMSGLKMKIASETSKHAADVTQEWLDKMARTQMAIHKKIISRKNHTEHNYPTNEDPIGDLLDKINANDASAPRLLVESGYYGLLHKCYKLPFGVQSLIFDLLPGSLVILDRGNVTFKKKALNSILRKILLLLRDRPCTKEELVEQIWGYAYDPLRHDPLIYSSMNKVRKFLENYGDWIELSEDGYRIKAGVKVIIKNNLKRNDKMASLTALVEKTQAQQSPAVKASKNFDLQNMNFRQMQVLEYLRKNHSISIFELSSKLEISKPTATRDLSQLHKMGKLKRVGKGRATRYLL